MPHKKRRRKKNKTKIKSLWPPLPLSYLKYAYTQKKNLKLEPIFGESNRKRFSIRHRLSAEYHERNVRLQYMKKGNNNNQQQQKAILLLVLRSRTAFYRSFDRVECWKREKEWNKLKEKKKKATKEKKKTLHTKICSLTHLRMNGLCRFYGQWYGQAFFASLR